MHSIECKLTTLDEADLNSYRPISNLSFVSKLVERVVAKRYAEHANSTVFFGTTVSVHAVQTSPQYRNVQLLSV